MRTSEAHPQVRGVDSLVARALALTARGDTVGALDILEAANKQAPNDPAVLYWRGMLLLRTTKLDLSDVKRNLLAWRLLSHGADVDPKNARFLLEMGRSRLRTPLLRIEAERLFRKALRVAEASGDPDQLAEVTYELGQIKERRYNSVRDRYMVTSRGLVFNPDETSQQRHYTKEFLEHHSQRVENSGYVDRAEAEDYYRRGNRAMPTHEGNALGLMRLLYDQKRYQEMRTVAQPFIGAKTGSAHIWLAAGIGAYRTSEMREATRLFDEALARMTDEERRDATSLSRIIRRGDAKTYDDLSAADRQNSDSAYWEAADPLLSTPENEGRLEFLSRVAIADLRFTDADMRTIGWRTDRGLILIRYGEPPIVAAFPPSSDRDGMDATGLITTVWFYPSGEREFVFTGPAAMNYAFFAGSMRGFAEEKREDSPFLLDNVPNIMDVDSLPVQIARFRAKSGDATRLVVAAAVDPRTLYGTSEFDRSALALSLRLGPPSKLRLTDAETLAVSLPASGTSTRVWSHDVPAGLLRVRVEAQDASVRGAAARAQSEVLLRPSVVGLFDVSDVLVLDRLVAPNTPLRGLDDLAASPRGTLTLRQRDTVSLYWENYGAKPSEDGRVRLDVKLQVTLVEIDRSQEQRFARLLGAVADAVGLTPEGEQTLGVRFRREEALGGRDRVPQVATIGLGSAPPGRYRLDLIVTDLNAGTVSRTERFFRLAPQ